MEMPENFNNVKHPLVRAYNRVVVAHNLREDFNDMAVEEYCENFSNEDRKTMVMVMGFIRKNGLEAFKTDYLRNIAPETTDSEINV